MPSLSTLRKKTVQLLKGTVNHAWEKARAIGGELTGVAFTAASAFDLKKDFFDKIPGTGWIFPAITFLISGITYFKEALQGAHDDIKIFQKNKLFDFLRTQLQAEKTNSTTSSLLNALKETASGKSNSDFISAVKHLDSSDIEMESSADLALTEKQQTALLLVLSNLYDQFHSGYGWKKYSHALLFAAFSLVSGFSEGLQISVFEDYNGLLFDFSNLIAVQSIAPAILTAIGLYHAIRSFREVQANYEHSSLSELEGFLTQLIFNITIQQQKKADLFCLNKKA